LTVVNGLMLILLLAAVAGVLAVLGWYAAEKRRKELLAWARAHGLSFSPAREYGFDECYAGFDALRQGSNRYACNVMRGSWRDWPLLAFDYHYETHSTDSKGRRQTHHHHFSMVILDSPIPLKPLFIRPEGFFDKVTEFFGFDDIDFESAEFSRRFYVKSPDRKWAYDVIHPRTMEFLLSQPLFTLQCDARHVAAHRGSTFSAAEFGQAVAVATGILERLPDYVVKQQQEGV
jgi:hypothetical protein